MCHPLTRLALFLAAATTGGCAVPDRVKQSPNWRNGAFHNLDREPRRNRTLRFLKWKMSSRQSRILAKSGDGAPRVEPDLERLHQRGFEGITWLGHATALIQLSGVNLLTDPIWGNPSGYRCRLVPQATPIGNLPPIHAVLISHDHRDHLDAATLRKLGPTPRYFVPLGTAPLVRRMGMDKVCDFDWWDSQRLGALKITFVPAHHWSRRTLKGDQTLWGGWMIESPSATVYFSGDTARRPVLGEIGRRFPGIGYALLAVGAYEPRWFMEPAHMNPEDAIQALSDLGTRRLIPLHWGTLQLGDEPPTEAPRRLRAEAQRCGLPPDALRILAIGETLPIPRLPASDERN